MPQTSGFLTNFNNAPSFSKRNALLDVLEAQVTAVAEKVQGPLCKAKDEGLPNGEKKMRLDFNQEEILSIEYFMDQVFQTKKS